MFRPKKTHILYFFIDLLFIFIALATPYFLRYNFSLFSVFDIKNISFPNVREYIFVFILWAVLVLTALKAKNLYSTDRTLSIPKEMALTLSSIFYVSIVVGTVIFFANFKFFSRWIFITSFSIIISTLVIWRVVKKIILRRLVISGYQNFNILIVGSNRIAGLLIDEMRERLYLGLRVVGIINDNSNDYDCGVPILGRMPDFQTICKKYFIDEVIITDSSRVQLISEISQLAKNMHIGVRIVPLSFAESLSTISINYLGIIPLLTYKERTFHPTELFLKRAFDFLIAFFLLLILFPFFLIIAFFIKVGSSGPVFYIQKRMGQKGRIFDFYKFRSMVKDADILKSDLLHRNEVTDGVIFKIKRDPRITKIGRFLRRFSLDELPQLINVLKGDMSLVGPRPFPVDESNKMESTHLPRLNIRPGITGLAQVKGRSSLTFYRWVKWDLWYINNWSFGLDLRIIYMTIPAIIKGRGAY